MAKNLHNVSFIFLFLASLFISNSFAQDPSTDSVFMGPGYSNEVYYSMADGKVLESSRDTWDIAFRTLILSSSILINDGKNVVLYTYPNADTSGWNSMDTTGLHLWTPMYNDPNDWENGAFMRNAAGGFDFGWGIYNMTTHNLTGDSLYIIMLRDGSFRKLWIKEKKSALNLYSFRFAFLDGTHDQTVTLDCNTYSSKDFVGYSLITEEISDFQPAKNSWDIVFTKYMSVQPNGMPYPVTGVLQNDGVKAQKYTGVPTSFIGYNPFAWDSTRSVIGYDWKYFDGAAYSITDSMVNFVRTKNSDVFKVVFTEFAGSSTGKIGFEKSKMAGLGLVDNVLEGYSVFPNPVTDRLFVTFSGSRNEVVTVSLLDLSGRTILERIIDIHVKHIVVETSHLIQGVYLLHLNSGGYADTKKIIIRR